MVRKVNNIEQEIRNAILLLQNSIDALPYCKISYTFFMSSKEFGFACANMEDFIRRSINRIVRHITPGDFPHY